MKFSELCKAMREFNAKHNIERKINYIDGIEMIGEIVIKKSFFTTEYSTEARTYQFSNYNKALTSGDLGYSIFAESKYDGDIMRIERLNDDDVESAKIVEERG